MTCRARANQDDLLVPFADLTVAEILRCSAKLRLKSLRRRMLKRRAVKRRHEKRRRSALRPKQRQKRRD